MFCDQFAGWRLLAADQGIGLRAGADALGAVLVTAGVMLGVYAIVQRAAWWAGIVAAALLAGFVVRQANARTPLLPLLTTLAAGRTGSSLAPQAAEALTSGYHLAWATGAILGAAAIAIAIIALRSPRRPQRDLTRLASLEESRAAANNP